MLCRKCGDDRERGEKCRTCTGKPDKRGIAIDIRAKVEVTGGRLFVFGRQFEVLHPKNRRVRHVSSIHEGPRSFEFQMLSGGIGVVPFAEVRGRFVRDEQGSVQVASPAVRPSGRRPKSRRKAGK